MGRLIDTISQILGQAQSRLETASTNVSNSVTPGYRQTTNFSELVGPDSGAKLSLSGAPQLGTTQSLAAGALTKTGNNTDLGLTTSGLFMVRGPEGDYLTRAGQFTRNSEGHLINAGGLKLVSADGNLVRVGSTGFDVASDGSITENGQLTGVIGIFEADVSSMVNVGGTMLAIGDSDVELKSDGAIQQGFLEGSNVSMSDQMLEMMSAIRQAETGAQLARTYDELLGRAIKTFEGN